MAIFNCYFDPANNKYYELKVSHKPSTPTPIPLLDSGGGNLKGFEDFCLKTDTSSVPGTPHQVQHFGLQTINNSRVC